MDRRFLQGGTNCINLWQILLDTQGTVIDACLEFWGEIKTCWSGQCHTVGTTEEKDKESVRRNAEDILEITSEESTEPRKRWGEKQK